MKDDIYLTASQFDAELERCLNCPTKPCLKACPVSCSPCDFIAHAKQKNISEAAKIIAAQNPLGETCGLICPNKFCVRACLRQYKDSPIRIPAVQAEIMRRARLQKLFFPLPIVSLNNKKIAIIGAGPAALGAISVLIRQGFSVTIFEKEASVGGALNLIPQARLPREIIAYEWQKFLSHPAVSLQTKTEVTDWSVLLKQGFDAVIVTSGEQKSRTLGIEGENLALNYAQYLRNPQDFTDVGSIAVIGGGEVAADCAVTAATFGAKQVEMFVRRRLSDMRVTEQERESLLKNRVNITALTRITKIEKQSDTLTLYTCKTQFNEEGHLIDVPHSEIVRKGFSHVILALGSTRDRELVEIERIFYAGDFATGSSTAVEAVASGKQVANEIIKSLSDVR